MFYRFVLYRAYQIIQGRILELITGKSRPLSEEDQAMMNRWAGVQTFFEYYEAAGKKAGLPACDVGRQFEAECVSLMLVVYLIDLLQVRRQYPRSTYIGAERPQVAQCLRQGKRVYPQEIYVTHIEAVIRTPENTRNRARRQQW